MSYSPIMLDYTESDGEEVLPPPPAAMPPRPAAIPPRKAPPAITELPRIPKKNKKQPLEDELDETIKAKNERKKKEENRSTVRQGEDTGRRRKNPSKQRRDQERNSQFHREGTHQKLPRESFSREKPRSILTAARWRKVHLESDSFKEGHLVTALARMLSAEDERVLKKHYKSFSNETYGATTTQQMKHLIDQLGVRHWPARNIHRKLRQCRENLRDREVQKVQEALPDRVVVCIFYIK